MRKLRVLVLSIVYGCGTVTGGKVGPGDASETADPVTQRLIVTPTTLVIPEATTKTLAIVLAAEPQASVVVNIASSNATAISVSPSSFTFTGGSGGNWSTPVQVELTAPLDKNDTSETATVTISGDGAGDSVPVATTVQDLTVVKQYGWPAPPMFTDSIGAQMNTIVAVQVIIDADTNLDAFGVFSRSAINGSLYRMALYREVGGFPGQIVAQMTAPAILGAGAVTFDVQPAVTIDTIDTSAGRRFWIAFEASMGANLTQSTSIATSRCVLAVPNITDAWPTVFDSTKCESTDAAINLWINTSHQ
jgi:hypothetical protein